MMGEQADFPFDDMVKDIRLPSAMMDYARQLTDVYSEPNSLAILGDLGRFAIIATLFATPGPLSQANIIDGMGPHLAGRARVAAHLAVLQDRGAIEREPMDGRSHAVTPTRWMTDWMNRWLAAMILPARPWWSAPEPAPAPSPAVLASYLAQVLAANRSGLNAFVTTPGVRRMMSLIGGHLLVLELVLASEGAQRIGEPLLFSRKAFAARYGMSRQHARDLTAEAEQLGWLSRADRRVVLSPTFAQEAKRWAVIHFALCNATLTGRCVETMRAASLLYQPE